MDSAGSSSSSTARSLGASRRGSRGSTGSGRQRVEFSSRPLTAPEPLLDEAVTPHPEPVCGLLASKLAQEWGATAAVVYVYDPILNIVIMRPPAPLPPGLQSAAASFCEDGETAPSGGLQEGEEEGRERRRKGSRKFSARSKAAHSAGYIPTEARARLSLPNLAVTSGDEREDISSTSSASLRPMPPEQEPPQIGHGASGEEVLGAQFDFTAESRGGQAPAGGELATTIFHAHATTIAAVPPSSSPTPRSPEKPTVMHPGLPPVVECSESREEMIRPAAAPMDTTTTTAGASEQGRNVAARTQQQQPPAPTPSGENVPVLTITSPSDTWARGELWLQATTTTHAAGGEESMQSMASSSIAATSSSAATLSLEASEGGQHQETQGRKKKKRRRRSKGNISTGDNSMQSSPTPETASVLGPSGWAASRGSSVQSSSSAPVGAVAGQVGGDRDSKKKGKKPQPRVLVCGLEAQSCVCARKVSQRSRSHMTEAGSASYPFRFECPCLRITGLPSGLNVGS